MKSKGFIIAALSLTMALLIGFASVVYIVDPFCQYHMPKMGFSPIFKRGTQVYINPGFAKHASYDSLVIGSSVSENFYASQFNKVFNCKAIKLPCAGAYSTNYKDILEVAFRSRQLENVFFSLDEFALWNSADEPNQEMPLYLYDTNLLNDVKYVLNKSTIQYMLDMQKNRLMGKKSNYDAAYNWDKGYEFSTALTLKQYERPAKSAVQSNPDKYIEPFTKNLDNITPFIEKHPDTQFYIFFPPYSIVWWDGIARKGNLDATINGLAYAMDRLLKFDNVHLYYFQNMPETTNLDNYREIMHYTEELNALMVDRMGRDEYRVTRENYLTILEDMRVKVNTFDFSVFFGKD
jgi:hypothetical protein